MSYVHELDMDALKNAFKCIIDIDTDLFAKQQIIEHELEKLKQTHNSLIRENNKKIFIFCLDSFYFQYRILHQEMEELSKFIVILNNRMYGEYYKLYNIMVSQLNERNILLQTIIKHKKYPIYKDLEQLKEYSIDEISEIHDTNLNIINELYVYYKTKQNTIIEYSHTSNINMTISNFIHTLEYENTLIREQLYLYVSYIEFFHVTQKRYLEKLFNRMSNFQIDVSENIINDANTSFIENLCNIKDVVISPPSSPASSIQSDFSDDELITEHVDLEVKTYVLQNTNIENNAENTEIENISLFVDNGDNVRDIAHDFGLDGIIHIDGYVSMADK